MMEMCRTCLQVVINGSQYFNLSDNEPDCFAGVIKSRLECCVPELTLNVVKNPVICTNCVDTLCDAYNFKKKCLEIEETIYQYMLKQNIKDDFVNIDTVFRWWEQNVKDSALPNSSGNEKALAKQHVVDNRRTKPDQSQVNHGQSEEVDEDDFCSEILNDIIQTADNINNSDSLDPNMQAFSKSVKDVIANSQVQDKSHLEGDKTNTVYEISDDSSDESNSVQIISVDNSNVTSNEDLDNSQKNPISKVSDKDKDKQSEKGHEKSKEILKPSSYGRNLKLKEKRPTQYRRKKRRRKASKSLKIAQTISKHFRHINDGKTSSFIGKGLNNKVNKSSNIGSEISAEIEDIKNSVLIDWNASEDGMKLEMNSIDIKPEEIDIKEEELLCVPENQEVSKPSLCSHSQNEMVTHSPENKETDTLDSNSQPQNVNIIAGMTCYLEDFSEFESRFSEYTVNTSYSEQLSNSSECSFALNNASDRLNEEYSNEDEHNLYKGYKLRPARQKKLENKMGEYVNKTKGNKHVRHKHLTKTYLKKPKHKCKTCKFTTFNKGILIKHLRTHQEKYGAHNPYVCESCNVKTNGDLLTHMFSNGQQKCHFCDFKELDVQNFLKHMSENHPNLCSCILCGSCLKCGRIFITISQMYYHVCHHSSNLQEHSYTALPK